MQSQNSPLFLIKTFKRHYRKVKEVAEILAASSGSFSFKYSILKDNMRSKVETPNDEATTRFVVLMRRFLDPASNLYYKHIWDVLREHFPEAIPGEHTAQLEEFIEKLNKGAIPLVVNQQQVTAENIYSIIANGDYFGKTDEEAVTFLQNIVTMPVVGHLLFFEFYSHNVAFFNSRFGHFQVGFRDSAPSRS